MSSVTRLGDLNTGHDACPPVPLMTASADVYINGRGAGRVNDSYLPHSCIEHPPHNDYIAVGSRTVYVNGRALARVGDAVILGGAVMQGSPNVFCGG